MQSMKSLMTPLIAAAVLGLGFGVGFAGDAGAAGYTVSTCRTECAAEFQACRAEGEYPGFYRCRTMYSACLRACG